MNVSQGYAVALLAVSLAAGAQPARQKDEERVAQSTDARCRKEVKDYVDTLRFVRQTAGEQIGDRVASGFITELELSRVVVAQGPCAAAQLLRDKGAGR